MLSKRVVLLVVALACLVALVPSAMFAQSAGTGTVAGTVTDPSGGALVGATVTLSDITTNTARTATTNQTGRYIFANVEPGTYNVSFNQTGFRVAKFADQVVKVSTLLTLNIAMELGSVSQTVEVTASGSDLQMLNATVGSTVDGQLLQNLPSIGRDAATFVTLQPGVSPDGSVAGAVVDQSSFLLDGGQNTKRVQTGFTVITQENLNGEGGAAAYKSSC